MPEQKNVPASELKRFLKLEQLRHAPPGEEGPHVKLRHVEVFLEAATLGNFAAASKSLGLSATSISDAIAALERDMGNITLFDRSNAGSSITEAGKLLVDKAERLLEAEAEMLSTFPRQTTPPEQPERRSRGGHHGAAFVSKMNTERHLHQQNAADVHAAVAFIEQRAPQGVEVEFPGALVDELKKRLVELAPSGESVDRLAKVLDLMQVSISDESSWAALADPANRASRVFRTHHEASEQQRQAAAGAPVPRR